MRGDQPKLTSGKWRADWIYVDDVIDGFMAAMLVPEIEGLTIDLGTGQLVSVEAMINRLSKLWEYRSSRSLEHYRVDFVKRCESPM